MATSAANKKDAHNAVHSTQSTTHQPTRRERSFVLQRPFQQGQGKHAQQRERSFIRDNTSRSSAAGTFQVVVNNQHGGGGKSRAGGVSQPANASGSPAAGRGKPNMEIYRPPGVRGNGDANASGGRVQFHASVNDSPQQQPRLTKSRTSLELNVSGSARNSLIIQTTPQVIATSGSPHHQLEGEIQTGHFALQRSKSSGSQLGLQHQQPVNTTSQPNWVPGDVLLALKSPDGHSELPDVSHFPESAQGLLTKISADPDAATSRSVMEAVKILISRVIESSRYASSTARYCCYVIEKETNETFLDSLLNNCQEYFQERDRLLRSANQSSSQRWVGFLNFINELYLQLKRKNLASKVKVGSKRLSPQLILLTLLAESCCSTLKQPSTQPLQELECLFFVLTGIGRDVENELPTKMTAVWNAIRDAFLEMDSVGAGSAAAGSAAIQRTLLQLVELRAAKWQLPATALTYYYPSMSGSTY